jgi:polysaccharide export outer membrane protein
MVSGDVKNPGRVSILDGVRSVVEAISRAGGLWSPPSKAAGTPSGNASNYNSNGSTPPASQEEEVVVRRQGQVVLRKQFSELLAGGDIGIQKDDEIVVRPNSRVFTVLGAVKAATNVPMRTQSVNLLDAMGAVGGLVDQAADTTGVYVFRMGDLQSNPGVRARVFRLDLSKPVSVFVAQQFEIHSQDVVYVATSPLYEYDKVLTSVYGTFATIGVIRGAPVAVTY